MNRYVKFIGTLNTVNMSNLALFKQQTKNPTNTTAVKIPAGYFVEIDGLFLKHIWKY